MGDLSIELWLNNYKYHALENILSARGEELEIVMQEKLSELYIQTVPEQERTEIDNRIEAERLAEEQRARETRKFSVYHITENGIGHYFESDFSLGLMQLALLLRRYQRGELKQKPDNFATMFQNSVPISASRFEEHVKTRMDNTGQITGVFDVDFDKQEISGVHIMEGWKTYSMKDANTAAYQAYRGDYLPEDERWNRFLRYLDGREIMGHSPAIEETAGKSQRRLTESDICFSDEIMEMDGKLNFYMDTSFNVDQVFGTHVETAENDDWLNVYANYDFTQKQVCDTLEITLNRTDDSCDQLTYPLNAHEKGILLKKMDAYCMEKEGVTLEAYSENIQAESEDLTGQTTQQM